MMKDKIALRCSAPYPPKNGDMKLFGEDTIMFSCDEGYSMVDGDNQATYMAFCENGEWSTEPPTCQGILHTSIVRLREYVSSWHYILLVKRPRRV